MQSKGVLLKRKLYLVIAMLFVILLTCSLLSSFSASVNSSAWDGEVAREFKSGTGSVVNPYVISTAGEFAHFKQVLEGEEASLYIDKNYVITGGFNYGEYEISINNELPFSGTIDGGGNLIYNATINNGLFNSLDGASIKNISFSDIDYDLSNETGALLANEIKDSKVDMVLFSGNANISADTTYGGLVYESSNSNYSNIILNMNITSESSDVYNFAYSLDSDSADRILIKNNNYSNTKDESDIVFNRFDSVSSINNIDVYANDDYKVVVNDNQLVIETTQVIEEEDNKEPSKPSKAPTRVVPSSTITEHASGSDGNTFYINDLTADHNYYIGLNYAEVRSTSIPSGNSTGYYDDENLVKVQIIYDGADINRSNVVGALSPINNENTNKFVYFKYYPLVRNSNGSLATNSQGDNYIRIELIDNPFTKRPYVSNTEYGFNGWVCNQSVDTTADLCENSVFSFRNDDYTRYMEIPVNGGSELVIHLNVSWYEADVVTSANSLTSFNSMSMQPTFTTTYQTVIHRYNAYWNDDYAQMEYIRSYNYNAGYLPVGVWYRANRNSGTYYYVSQANSVRADRWWGDTTLYTFEANTVAITEGSQYTGGSVSFVVDFNPTGNNTDTTITAFDADYMNQIEEANGTFSYSEQVAHYNSEFTSGTKTGGFFYKVESPTAAMIDTGEYYSNNGTLCASANACTTAYKLIQYNDSVTNANGNSIYTTESNNGEIVDADKYYYLVTRDLNIFRYTTAGNGNNQGLSANSLNTNRPFTLTGTAVNGTAAAGVLNLYNYNLTAANDLVIENILVYGPNTAGTDNTTMGNNSRTSYTIYANSKNVKLGRNLISRRNTSYLVGYTIMGGTNNASGSGIFRVIVESGFYYAYHSGAMSGSTSATFNETTIFGNDYDRINNTNNKLKFLIGLDGYAGGNNTAGSDSLFASYNIVKSGSFGFNSDGTPNSDNTAGLYIGARAGTYMNSLTGAKIEGGTINTVVGGYGYNGSNTTNSTFIGMSGGTVRSIYGGAGHSTTKGNRIICVTGGTVSYSVLGGSDSYNSGDTDDGIVQGSTLVYVGGMVTVGGGSGELYGVEAGSVFGAGGGDTSSTQKGTVYNSHVIINGGTINTSVYGGGNHGSTGTQNSATSSTVIDIYSGTIGSVFGGSKSADFGKSGYQTTSTIDINITGGTITNVYGGSNTEGTIYGSIDIDITGGTISGNVYGGGQGNQTAVSRNVDLTIGDNSTGPTISGSVYGGSAYGSVNSNNAGEVNVTVNKGTITGSVFGGGQGSATYTPVVNGDITVTVNGGTIGNVFGGNDQAGNHTKQNEVYLNGGTITNVYGGGNLSSVSNTHVYLDGATVTDLYGGSNTSGNVNTTTVLVTSGSVANVYGGNNAGGTDGSTSVEVKAGTVSGNIYGGGKGNATVVTGDVNVTIGDNTLGPTISGSVYGGSAFGSVNSANSGEVNVTVNKGTIVGSVFGGGQGSNVYTPYVNGDITVTINGGDITAVYGGNDQAGSHTKQNDVYLNGGTIGSVYGGGNRSSVTTTNVHLQGSTVTSIYGGSNSLGDVITTNVSLSSGSVGTVYGGNNVGGTCTTTNVTAQGTATISVAIYGGGNEVNTTTTNVTLNSATGTIPNVYGGGNQASVTTTNITQNGTTVTNLFGGSNTSGSVNNSYITHNSGTSTTVYGGNNAGGNTITTHINYLGGNSTNIYGGGNQATSGTSTVSVSAGTISGSIFGGGNSAGLTTSNVTVTGGTVSNVYGGSDTTGLVTTANVLINTSGSISNVFGGGNRAAVGTPTVVINNGTIGNVYGGGNLAEVQGSTTLDINGGTFNSNIYGGGNYGVVRGNSLVTITDATISGSAYAGGNGESATLYGNTHIIVDGTTTVGTNNSVAPASGSVFGGGNKAATGSENSNNSTSTVDIAGGTFYGNVYGGANTSVIYGSTVVNIGKDALTNNNNLDKDDIFIKGHIFGGGEANASGSPNYDWSFISVTEGTEINVDADTYTNFDIKGSFYGGGNASSASGDSYLNIKNYGVFSNPKRNVSIQRVTYVEIDNSNMVLKGAVDRANDYATELFAISRVEHFKIKNNTSLFFETGANLLEDFSSVDANDQIATVTINENTNTITSRNVDNRIYMYEGKNLNIAKNQQVSDYGEVHGMSFLGIFNYDNDNNVNTGIYNKSYNGGDLLDWSGTFSRGSYVVGKHTTNHNIKVNGFYSHYINEDTTVNEIKYIEPTPDDAQFYMWFIGENVIEYNVNLAASKYSTLGSVETPFYEFSAPNTSFQVLSFDSSEITPGISLVDKNSIPRIASTEAAANSVFGLSMEASNSGWLTSGKTNFFTREPSISGETYYEGENTTTVPSMLFYLYHSKNISLAQDLGTVRISIMAITKTNALSSEIRRLVINVNMSTALFQTTEYEGAMTPGDKYELFASTQNNITTKSKFSAYFALYGANTNMYQTGYHRVLTSSFVLPENTKITMLDYSSGTPLYYYHVITAADVQAATTEFQMHNEASYPLSMFTKMGSMSNSTNYDDAAMNAVYYDGTDSSEEFIFIVDFSDSNINTTMLENKFLIEMRDGSDNTIISVLGIQRSSLLYNLYSGLDSSIQLDVDVSDDPLYIGYNDIFDVTINYQSSSLNGAVITDTQYFDSKLGSQIYILNGDGNIVSGTDLTGTYFMMDNVVYYPDIAGYTHIKLSNKIGNTEKWIIFNTDNSTLATGDYTFVIETYASADGIYYSKGDIVTERIPVTIISSKYGLNPIIADESVILNAEDPNNLTVNIAYTSLLENPEIRVAMYRRKYDQVYDTNYELVDLQDYVDQPLFGTDNTNEYLVIEDPLPNNVLTLIMDDGLLTGTYRLAFRLYDNDTMIGEVIRYVIIK